MILKISLSIFRLPDFNIKGARHREYASPTDLGLSALDQRRQAVGGAGAGAGAGGAAAAESTPYLPASSYLLANIDELALAAGLTRHYDVIWSSATFYHLVDPLGALAAAYDRLAPGGFLLVRHFPLAAQLALQGGSNALRAACGRLVRFWKQRGVDGAVCETKEKPGLCFVALRKGKEAAAGQPLPLPYEHTGKVMSLGGANGWRYAKVRVIEHAPGPAPVPEPENSSDIELCSIAQFLEQVGVLLPEAPLPSAPARAAAAGKFRPVLVLDLDGTLI